MCHIPVEPLILRLGPYGIHESNSDARSQSVRMAAPKVVSRVMLESDSAGAFACEGDEDVIKLLLLFEISEIKIECNVLDRAETERCGE